jgi:hypothetical protein
MIIAVRTLRLRSNNRDVEIPIRVFAPERAKVDWSCRFEIEWPDQKLERFAIGIDAVQALLLALQMIGAIVYTSKYHEEGKLQWMELGRGYGFPVTNGIRDILTGDDKKCF